MSRPEQVRDALHWAMQTLQAGHESAGVDTDAARVDATALLSHVLDKPRSYFFAWPEQRLTDPQSAQFSDLVARRAQGEPVAYLTGHKAFWTLDLLTEPSTLIPRPDTETLVQAVLDRAPLRPLDVVDLGTGTGAIALALASERPQWRISGLDRVPAAIDLATRNGSRNGLPQVRFAVSDWCTALADHSVDVLVSNPPYVRPDDQHLAQGDVRFEPLSALTAEDHGLAGFRGIIAQSLRVLRAGGWLFFEHGYDQAEEVALLLIDAGFEALETVPDLSGHRRVTLGRRSERIR